MRSSDCVGHFPAPSCTRPLPDLQETRFKEVKDFCSAASGSRWRKTGWAEVQSACFLFAPERTLSPPSLRHAVVIAACDLFLAEPSFFLKVFQMFPSALLSPFNPFTSNTWKENQVLCRRNTNVTFAKSVFELHVWFIVNITNNKEPAKQWIRLDNVWFLL